MTRLDPDAAVAVMRAAGLEPLEPFGRGADPWLCRCLTCGRSVTPIYRNVAQGQGGCVWCSGHRTDPDDAAAIMRAAGLEPLEPFKRVMTPWRCRCLSCKREVRPILNNVRRGHAGCVYCAGRKNEPAEAAEVMLAAGVEPLEPYPGGQNHGVAAA